MSTNYYARPPGTCTSPCENWVHIGKSSAGWYFLFHGYKSGDLDSDYVSVVQITTMAEMMEFAGTCEIYDEYGTHITVGELQEIIARHASGKPHFGSDYAHDPGKFDWYFGDFS